MDSAVTNWNAGIECDTPDNVHVNGHSLVLTATRKRTAQPCGKLPSTRYLSGMVSTVNTFSLTYGRVEMRARLPKGVGMHPAFWMLPTNPSATGSYEYGEIDVAEAYGAYPDTVMPHLHYVSTPNVLGGVNCTVLGATSGYHTYRLDWTPTEMTFTYDGSTCWSTPWQPLYPYASKDATQPVPFDQPFYLLIALAVDGSDSAKNAVTGHTKFPEKMLVDYVRVWE
jgi:beta-glucanase (GH16 family)